MVVKAILQVTYTANVFYLKCNDNLVFKKKGENKCQHFSNLHQDRHNNSKMHLYKFVLT